MRKDKMAGLLAAGLALTAMADGATTGKTHLIDDEPTISGADKYNRFGLSSFVTDGFKTYSVNQAAHDEKFKRYCKKKGINPPLAG